MHILAQHVQGHVAALCHPCQLPILQEKRDLVTGPTQPDDEQRNVAHIAISRATTRRTFVFRQASPSLSIGLFGQPTFNSSPSLPPLKDISRETGEADARIDEKAAGLTVRRNRRFLLNQEEKELAMRPILPWHMDAVRKHTIHRIQVGPNALPDRFSHKLWRKPTPAIAESTFPKALRAETFNPDFLDTSGHCPAQQLDL